MAMCEDFPACGHTDGLGCDWKSPNDDPTLYFCTNEHGWGGEPMWHTVGTACPMADYE
jgi:hypothetical protein